VQHWSRLKATVSRKLKQAENDEYLRIDGAPFVSPRMAVAFFSGAAIVS
jgi:hypothetical protein